MLAAHRVLLSPIIGCYSRWGSRRESLSPIMLSSSEEHRRSSRGCSADELESAALQSYTKCWPRADHRVLLSLRRAQKISLADHAGPVPVQIPHPC